jgi:hypothetical protein
MNRYVVNGIGRKTSEDDRNVFDFSVPIVTELFHQPQGTHLLCKYELCVMRFQDKFKFSKCLLYNHKKGFAEAFFFLGNNQLLINQCLLFVIVITFYMYCTVYKAICKKNKGIKSPFYCSSFTSHSL